MAAEEEAEAARVAAEAEASRRAEEPPVLTFEPGPNLDDQIAAYERGLGTPSDATLPEIAPMPTAVSDAPLSWPQPAVGATAAQPNWPDAAAPRGPGAHLPAASQPVVPLAARACPSCGLSLSASARFCRRCGTQQQAAV